MSRRKVRGLTRTGRQVSEDPDLDNLLSNLSPEEMEELQKEVSTVPDPDPSEIIADQTDLKESRSNKKKSSFSSHDEESRMCLQRNLSTEVEPKRESRKQEYLRKMGLSQEKTDTRVGGLQGQTCISTPSHSFKQEAKVGDRKTRTTEEFKNGKTGQFIREEDNRCKDDFQTKEQNYDCKLKEKTETREGSSKMKELISKLQVKQEDCKEKDKKEESWKRECGDSKTRDLITRLQEKEERKELGRKEEARKREDKMKCLISKLEEKQSQVTESKTDDQRKVDEKEKMDKELVKSNNKDNIVNMPMRKDIYSTYKENEKVKKEIDIDKTMEVRKSFDDRAKDEAKVQILVQNNLHESRKEEAGNHMAEKNTKTKEEEDEEEFASMFAEDLEKVSLNDPDMTELNVNNSEVIKVKTLIQFAEALNNNTHIKTFALANCRADDHVAYAIAGTLRNNKVLTSINLDSNLLTSKGIMALVQALQHNSSLTELRFHNQRHICGGKTEMEMTKILKENTTLLKLGYHFELAGPRMTMTNILSRNMDRQRQKRLQEQKLAQAQANGDKKDSLEVPKPAFNKVSPRSSPRPSPTPSPVPSPKLPPRKRPSGLPPSPPPPPPPILDGEFLKNSLTPVSQRKLDDRAGDRGGSLNSRDKLLASIRGANVKQLKKVALPKLLQ